MANAPFTYEDGVLYVHGVIARERFEGVREIVLLSGSAYCGDCIFILAPGIDHRSLSNIVTMAPDHQHERARVERCVFLQRHP